MASYTTNLPVNNRFNITAAFGEKGSLWKNGHKGVDITADDKTLYAVCDGEVTFVGFDKDGWGRYVSIMPNGFERIRIITCHMVNNSAKVKKGDKVSRITKIGTMGSTGNSTGVHVHIEMRIDNTPVDITPYLLLENKRVSGLISENYKFDASKQASLLSKIQNAFDGKETTDSDQIDELKKQINDLQNRLSSAEEKIKKAIEALN